jgi:hypothetical protein
VLSVIKILLLTSVTQCGILIHFPSLSDLKQSGHFVASLFHSSGKQICMYKLFLYRLFQFVCTYFFEFCTDFSQFCTDFSVLYCVLSILLTCQIYRFLLFFIFCLYHLLLFFTEFTTVNRNFFCTDF